MDIIYTTEALYPSHSFTKHVIFKTMQLLTEYLFSFKKRIRHIVLMFV